jgi:hypothetical protein
MYTKTYFHSIQIDNIPQPSEKHNMVDRINKLCLNLTFNLKQKIIQY